MSVTVKDRGANALLKQARGSAAARVGVIGNKAQEPEQGAAITVGEVATIHELGLGVPERSFIRAYVDDHKEEIQNDLRRGMRQVLALKLTKEQALQIVALKHVAGIQARIVAGINPPNAESTIARKGSSTPLIDTGQLKSAITYELERL